MRTILYSFIFLSIAAYAENKINLVVACHGNMDLTPHLSLENFKRFYYDDIAGSTYEHNVKLLRADPFFCLHHPMQATGLQPINLCIEKNNASGLFGVLHRTLSRNGSYIYYTFGWSGLQSPKVRLLEAALLYKSLEKEVLYYQTQGYTSHITLIGYSHGGNVALNTAAYFDIKQQWHIDQLVLLGVPIMAHTKRYAQSNLFKKVYNFYSFADRVQPLDCFSQGHIFSGRLLSDSACPRIYDIQVSIKKSDQALSSPLYHPLQRAIKKNDPSHVEWWSFGWTSGYRNSFCLHPLPISIFTPLFIDAIERCSFKDRKITIDLHAYKNVFYLHTDKKFFELNFITPSTFNRLKHYAQCVQPDHYSKRLFKQKVDSILQHKVVAK